MENIVDNQWALRYNQEHQNSCRPGKGQRTANA